MKMLSVSSLSLRGVCFLLGLLGAFLLGVTLVRAEPYLVVSGDLRGEIKPLDVKAKVCAHNKLTFSQAPIRCSIFFRHTIGLLRG